MADASVSDNTDSEVLLERFSYRVSLAANHEVGALPDIDKRICSSGPSNPMVKNQFADDPAPSLSVPRTSQTSSLQFKNAPA